MLQAQSLSADSELYLRPDTRLEPLMCRWPAWPHLLAPAPHAMNLAYRHLGQLRSFVSNPEAHAAAARDPTLFGGPFVCLQASDVSAVQELIQRTCDNCAELLKFAAGLRDFNEKVQSEAKGSSLEALYGAAPDAIAGFVELVYDLNNHPRVKIIEPLLSRHLDTARGMQEICLHRTPDRERPFFMSTPVLEDPERTFLALPFDHEVIARLAEARRAPLRLGALADTLPVGEEPLRGVERYFTTTPPVRKSPAYAGDGVRIRYFGHACILLQTSEVSILIDPLTAWSRDDGLAKLTFDDLPDFIDYVVITHTHHDHFHPEMLIQLRSRVGVVVVPKNDPGNLADPSAKLILRRMGYREILELDALDSLAVPGGEICSVPFIGEHADLDVMSKQCVFVRLKGKTALFLVDSNGVEPRIYRHIAKALGPVDTAFIGMECFGAPLSWFYGPLFTKPINRRDDQSRRLSGSDCERAQAIVRELRCPRVFVYAMGQEPWLRHIMGLEYEPESIQLRESERFVERCRQSGISAERLHGCREWEL